MIVYVLVALATTINTTASRVTVGVNSDVIVYRTSSACLKERDRAFLQLKSDPKYRDVYAECITKKLGNK